MSNIEVEAVRFIEDDPIDPDCIKRSEVCEGEPFFGEQEGKRYCVLHFPGADKKDDFDIAFKRKLVITLQRPEPRPLTATAWFAVLAETIIGPIQAALLILAVRRRFMR